MLPNGLTRQYSLCGDRWDAYTYRVGVLREPASRGGSAYVHDQLQPGDLVGVGGPRNNFPLVPSQRYLFVAGGIGITPLLPMIQQADLLGADWQLLYGGRRRASMAFLDELAALRRPRAGRPPGRVRPARPRRRSSASRATDVQIYCCGPGPLLAAIEAACARLAAAHAAHRAVRRRGARRPGARAPVRGRAGPHRRDRDRHPGHVGARGARPRPGSRCCPPAGRASAAPARPPCSPGRPDHRDSLLDDDERAAGDCMYICVSRSCTDRLVLDL